MLRTTWALTASVVFSCLLALLLEQSDKTLRSVRQVERHLGLPCLALAPTVPRAKRRFGLHRSLLGSPASAYARSEEHTSEPQSLMRISYSVFYLEKKDSTRTQRKQIKYKVYKKPT